jgi:hypothetical protein
VDFDFDQISSMLGSMSEEEMKNLQEAAQSLFGAFGGEGTGAAPPAHEQAPQGEDFASMLTPELLAKLSHLMGHMNRSDPRSELILALKPHLSRKRQKRAEQAVQMMKLFALLPMLQDAMK